VESALDRCPLHDVGKLDELCTERAVSYTAEANCLAHHHGTRIRSKEMDAIEVSQKSFKTVVQHILISHHGEYEFGSPSCR